MKTLLLSLCFASLLFADRLMVDTATHRGLVQRTELTNRVQTVSYPALSVSNELIVMYGTNTLSLSGTVWRVSGYMQSNVTQVTASKPHMVGPARTDAVLSRTLGQSGLRLTNTLWQALDLLITSFDTNAP